MMHLNLRKMSFFFSVMLLCMTCMSAPAHAGGSHSGRDKRSARHNLVKANIHPPIFTSVKGRPIDVFVFGAGKRTVLVVGGIHGDEAAGVVLARALVAYIRPLPAACFSQRVVVMPAVNPDGSAAHTRYNAHRIDLNRNFPAKDFGTGAHQGRYYGGHTASSEPETRAVMQVVTKYQPAVIIAFHAPLACINYDGQASDIVQRFAKLDGFPVVGQLGKRTPGSLGTYYGKERGLPVITLELNPRQQQWAQHEVAILDAIGVMPGGNQAN